MKAVARACGLCLGVTGKMPVLRWGHERAERFAAMRATLIVVGGKASKGRVSLDLPIVIGRSRSSDLTVAHPMISRRHCEIYDSSGLLMVRDLDSLNGTLVAGQKISEAALRPDDEFTVGPLTFRVDYEYSAEMEGAVEGFAVAEIAEDLQVEISAGGCELDEPSPPPVYVAPDIPPELEETLPEDEGSGIAPRDGQLPDLLDEPSPPPIYVAPDIPPELEETLPEDEGSGIAPRDGQLPDLSQWADPLEDPKGGMDGDGEASVPVDPPPDEDGGNDFR